MVWGWCGLVGFVRGRGLVECGMVLDLDSGFCGPGAVLCWGPVGLDLVDYSSGERVVFFVCWVADLDLVWVQVAGMGLRNLDLMCLGLGCFRGR